MIINTLQTLHFVKLLVNFNPLQPDIFGCLDHNIKFRPLMRTINCHLVV